MPASRCPSERLRATPRRLADKPADSTGRLTLAADLAMSVALKIEHRLLYRMLHPRRAELRRGFFCGRAVQ